MVQRQDVLGNYQAAGYAEWQSFICSALQEEGVTVDVRTLCAPLRQGKQLLERFGSASLAGKNIERQLH